MQESSIAVQKRSRIMRMAARIAHEIISELSAWLELIVCSWPETHAGRYMRRKYWRKKFNIAVPGHISRHVNIYGQRGNIHIGERFSCGENVEINFCTSHGIYIGHDVLMARGAYIRAANHRVDRVDIPINQQGHQAEAINYQNKTYSVVIEDDVWIGANAIILSGAKIGKGSVVAAGAVVTNKEFPPFSIIAGVPAKVIKNRLATE